jgi:hypothetical protein
MTSIDRNRFAALNWGVTGCKFLSKILEYHIFTAACLSSSSIFQVDGILFDFDRSLGP